MNGNAGSDAPLKGLDELLGEHRKNSFWIFVFGQRAIVLYKEHILLWRAEINWREGPY